MAIHIIMKQKEVTGKWDGGGEWTEFEKGGFTI